LDHYDDLYEGKLSEMGYKCIQESRRGLDSILIGYKADKFELIDHKGVQHNDLVAEFGDDKNHFKRGNCALVSLL